MCLDAKTEPRMELIALVEAKFVTNGSWRGDTTRDGTFAAPETDNPLKGQPSFEADTDGDVNDT